MAVVRSCRGACQWVGRRIPDREALEREVAAWAAEPNALGERVDRRLVTVDARIEMKRLYPSIDV